MKTERFVFAGLALSGIGVFTGITLSSAVPGTPLLYGTTIAVYAAVVAAVLGGVRKRGGGRSRQ